MADTDHVLNLAAIIREVDGTHSKGAAALAESILDHPRFRAVVAAALRAAADQVVPLCNAPKIPFDAKRPTVEWHVWDAKQRARADLLAIAAELEDNANHND